MIHGLDELVEYYRYHEQNGLQHRLDGFVPCSPCPSGVRLHGTENLLHRAAAAGDANVVSELLGCSYRNLSAKNHDGQTAVHLAAFFGCDDVLRVLTAASPASSECQRVSVNVVDSSGYSPLHFAAQAGKASAIRILLGLEEEVRQTEGGSDGEGSASSSSNSSRSNATFRSKSNPIARNQVRNKVVFNFNVYV